MDRTDFVIDRRTLLRVTAFKASIPVGAAGASKAELPPWDGRRPQFRYDGLAVDVSAEEGGGTAGGRGPDAGLDDEQRRQRYGEFCYGGASSEDPA